MFSGEKIPSFQIIQERSYSSAIFLKRPSFQNIWRKYLISMYVFFRERSSFILRLKNKIIFSGKPNIIFPDYIKEIILQCTFFGKIIFWGDLEKRKYGLLCSGICAIRRHFFWLHVLIYISCVFGVFAYSLPFPSEILTEWLL